MLTLLTVYHQTLW